MKIALVHPPALMAKFNYSTLSHPPLGLAYIAAYLRENGHTVDIIDGVGEGMQHLAVSASFSRFIIQGLPADAVAAKIDPASRIIGFSCMFTHAWPIVRQLIAVIREHFPEAVLIAGGEHVTALYDFCLKDSMLDGCIVGEGEETMAAVARAMEKGGDWRQVPGVAARDERAGSVSLSTDRARITDLDRLPHPAWDLVPLEAYTIYEGAASTRTIPLLATRGCPHQCAFCSAPNMWGRVWRSRDPRKIAIEMAQYKRQWNITSFQFVDISPFIDKSWLQALCAAIIASGMDIVWQMPVGMRFEMFDEQTARLMVQSGCTDIQFAPESGSPRVLAQMNKKIVLTDFEKSVDAALNAGMTVSVLFILGYPGEKLRDVRLTYGLIRRLAGKGVHEIAISSYIPIPGSAMFTKLYQSGQIELSDQFFQKVAGATDLLRTTSWNPEFGGRCLIFMKWLGLLQFYLFLFLFRPARAVRFIRNAISGRQQTKTDRALAEIIAKLRFIRNNRRTDQKK